MYEPPKATGYHNLLKSSILLHIKANLLCNFQCETPCTYSLYCLKKGVNDNVIADTEIGPLSLELACTYNAGDPIKAKKCPAAMAKIQKKVNSNAKIYGETPRKYVNTPGCHDDDFFSFGERQVFFYS